KRRFPSILNGLTRRRHISFPQKQGSPSWLDPPRDSIDKKILKQCPQRAPSRTHQRNSYVALRYVPVALKVLEIRDSCCRQVAQNIGVVRLPVPVVASADHHARDGIQRPRPDASRALVEVTRILVQ